jgi:hypothetical protein
MGILKLNTDNEGSFQERRLVDAGTYILSIANLPVKLVQSKSSSNQMFALELKVESLADGTETPFKGQTIYDNLVITAKAEFKIIQFMMSTGLMSEQDIKDQGGVDMDILDSDTRVTAKIAIESYCSPDNPTVEKHRNKVEQYVWEAAE